MIMVVYASSSGGVSLDPNLTALPGSGTLQSPVSYTHLWRSR